MKKNAKITTVGLSAALALSLGVGAICLNSGKAIAETQPAPYTYFQSNDGLTVTENYASENGNSVKLTLDTADKSTVSFDYLNYIKTSELPSLLTMGFEPTRVGEADFEYVLVTIADAVDSERSLTYAVSPQPASSGWWYSWTNSWISLTDDLVPTTKAAYSFAALMQVEGTSQMAIGRNSGAIGSGNQYYRGNYMDCGYIVGPKATYFARETEGSKLSTLSFGLMGGTAARIAGKDVGDITEENYLAMASENLGGTKYADLYDKERAASLFTSGYVSMSVKFMNVTSDTVSCYITNIGEQSFAESGYVRDSEPYFFADVNTNAVKGIPYTLPVAKSHNFRDGDLVDSVSVAVEKAIVGTPVEVNGGKVVFAEAGNYTIKYTITDGRNNEFVRSFTINCLEETPQTAFVYDVEYAAQYATGDTVIIPVAKAYSDLSLRADKSVDTVTLLQRDGAVVEVFENLQASLDYSLEEAGAYNVVILYQDAFGQIQSVSESFTVAESVGIAPELVPVTFTAGKVNTLTDFNVKNYVSNVGYADIYRAIYINDTQVYLAKGNSVISGSLALPANTFSAEGSATLTYKAGLSQSDLAYAKSYAVPVIKPKYISDYFAVTNALGEVDKSGVTVRHNREDVVFLTTADKTFTLPQYLPSDTLDFNFGGSADGSSFEYLRVALKNGYNGKTIAVDLYPESAEKSIAKVGGKSYAVNGSLMNEKAYLQWTWSDAERSYLDQSGAVLFDAITEYTDGTVFDGFNGAPVSLSFSVCGVEDGESGSFLLRNVLNQAFGSTVIGTNVQAYQDLVTPIIRYEEQLEAKAVNIATLLTIPTARAYDVLDCVVTLDVTLVDENNNAILPASPCTQEYEILFSNFGVHKVIYTAKDSNEFFSSTDTYVYTVRDFDKPVLSVNGTVATTAKVGETVTFPEGLAFDNVTVNCKCYVMVYAPHGERRVVDGKYTFKEAGKYKVVYFAFDEEFNSAQIEYTVVVS